MTCEEFVELVTAYLEGVLPEDVRETFDEHMALCPGCDRYLDQFRTTIDALGALPQESLSPPARDRLLDAFAEWRGTSGPHGGA
jgi:anti-sigma factor RsiW